MRQLEHLVLGSLLLTSAYAQVLNANNGNSNTNYFPQQLNLSTDITTYFSVSYHNNYKLVTDNRNHQTYALVQSGTPVPGDLANGTEVYQIPVTKVAALETTVVPYLEMLGVANTISVIQDGSFVASACFEKRLAQNQITDLSATNQTLRIEQLKSVQVQFGVNTASADLVANTSVTSAEAYEPTALGRASWLAYYALFYNLEASVNQMIPAMFDNYNRLKKAAANYNPKPLVAWTVYNAPDQYNNNTASWGISTVSYKAGLTADAGGRILSPSTTTFSSADAFLAAIADVDVLIDETYIAKNLTDVLNNYKITDESKYKFLKNKALYREDGILTQTGGYDWFEAPMAMADALLEDVINAINPSAPSKDYQRHWLRNVATAEPIKYVSAANCTWDESKPRPDVATNFQGADFTMVSNAATAFMSTAQPVLMITTVIFSALYLA
ncbi:hypothetical protein DFQ28_010792 [Apophysomyces sp. BC1034]|nr:hypothetical protein DFQ30_001198 [Apophysomyces sp. BC1015]KAG0181344.1 hypothetical protein DFQ29_008614 [Apophysomyces sp. BC1021]KAG0191853.1 hypothetical protein DFQ28_010792 [Apophysomyces sp. BC1034]